MATHLPLAPWLKRFGVGTAEEGVGEHRVGDIVGLPGNIVEPGTIASYKCPDDTKTLENVWKNFPFVY